MGGKGSGGKRANAGRRRKSQEEGALTGSRRVLARAQDVNQNTSNQTSRNQNAPTPPPQTPTETLDVQIPQPPGSLTLDELAEWNDLAPRAAKEGTLSDSTQMSLRDLCRLRVLQDRLVRQLADDGDVVFGAAGQRAAHPLLTRITTLSQRIDAAMIRFKLAPLGRELPAGPEKPVDDGFGEFDQPAGGRTH